MATPLEERMARIEGPFEQIDRRLGRIENHLDRLDSRLDQLDARITQMDTRVHERIDRLMYWQLGLMGAVAASILATILTRLV